MATTNIYKHLLDIKIGRIPVFFRKVKNLLNLLVTILYAVICIPLIVIIRCLRPLKLIRFGPLISQRLGHFAANTELYCCMRDAGLLPHNSFDLFFYSEPYICNRQLKKMWDRNNTVRVWSFSEYLYIANKWLPGGNQHTISTSDRDVHDLYSLMRPHIEFTVDEEKKGAKELYRIGIKDETKFICFAARDSDYLKTVFPRGCWNYHDYRDSDIDNFLLMGEEFANRGYFLLRMGAIVKKPLRHETTQIIDYAKRFRTDFLDIYLLAKCYFYIGDSLGINAIPYIFRKPVATTNTVHLEYLNSWGQHSLFIPKKNWLIKERRLMTFREIFESGVGRFLFASEYGKMGIELIENTPEEIKDLAVEMDERLRGVWNTTKEDEELQAVFWSLFKKSKLHGIIKSRIGASFLRNNKELLKF